MELKHNMNTFADKEIPSTKVRKLMLGDKSDALSVLTYMYDKHMEKG